jgi:hypothetical protein
MPRSIRRKSKKQQSKQRSTAHCEAISRALQKFHRRKKRLAKAATPKKATSKKRSRSYV